MKNPDLQLPHGDAQLVRTFLRTLPAQYGEFARRKRGITSDNGVTEFTTQQIRQLLTQFASGEEMERAVFFTKDPYKGAQQSDATTRAKYAGCAFCHEVKQTIAASYSMPEVTRPVLLDRWLTHGAFAHAKHTMTDCRTCHAAEGSSLTSDVLIPTKESCTSCHAPKGTAANASQCTTCHAYHAPDPQVTAATRGSAFKQMLLGRAR